MNPKWLRCQRFQTQTFKTDSSFESFLKPKKCKTFSSPLCFISLWSWMIEFFGPLSPMKTRFLKLSSRAPAGQLQPLRTPRFMPSVLFTGFKGLVQPKIKKIKCSYYLLTPCTDWKVQTFQELHSNSPEQLKQPETWNASIRLRKPRDAKSIWKDKIYILNMRPSSCAHVRRGAHSLPSAPQLQGRFRLIKVCKKHLFKSFWTSGILDRTRRTAWSHICLSKFQIEVTRAYIS